ncbi:MAG: hypothetical protein ACOVOR_03340 [Rhabdochlamydiaceae bacterium]
MVFQKTLSRLFYACFVFVLFSLSAYSCFSKHCNSRYSIREVLQAYGFQENKQIEAIEDLFQRSGVIPSYATLDHAFPPRNSKEDLVIDIINMLQSVQKKFILRTGSQERWEVEALKWMEHDKDKILQDLKVLGFIDPILPKHKNADSFCILGAAAARMKNRIDYAQHLLSYGVTTKNVILLAGERYVTKGIDGTEDQLISLSKSFGLSNWTQLTETHLIEDLYLKSELFQNSFPFYVINTPRRELPRPTTQTTILELLNWLSDHKAIHRIIFVSNQPHVKYQEAVINLLLKEHMLNIQYEVVGNKATNVNDVCSVIGALGSYMWTITPDVLAKMHIQIEDQNIKNLLRRLYEHNPIIYNTVPKQLR